jgi:hypothetical protein
LYYTFIYAVVQQLFISILPKHLINNSIGEQIMFGFIKKMLGLDQAEPKVIEAPYKVEAPVVAESAQPDAAPAKVKKPRKPRAAKKSVKK